MATILAAANGNWSATGTWTGGVVPTAGDTVYLNNKNVTLNVNPTASLISNLPLSGAANGGTLVLSDGVVITANLTCGTVSLITHSGGENFTVVGDITGGSGSSIRAINSTGTGNIVIIGNLYGGTGASGDAVRVTNASATVSVTGNVYGSATVNSNGLYSSALTSVITGNIYGGSPASGGYGISHAGNGTMTINGDVVGGSQVATNYGIYNSSGGTVIITGTAEGGHAGAAVRNQSTGAVYVKRVKGNGWGVGSIAPVVSSTVGLDNFNQAGIAYAEELEFGALGQVPVSGTVRLTDVVTNVVLMHRFGTTHKVLSDPANTAGLVPDESDVRLDVEYALGNKTGTCAVPPASAVGSGVPIDDTVGTAALTAQAVWEYATRTLTESAGGGLDAAGVRAAIGLASPDLDTQLAGISTKTSALPAAPAAVSDIPSAAANATAVRDELADELANLDAPISEISTGLDATGVRTAIGLASPDLDTQLAGISTKTSALPAAPAAVSDIPSAAANATAVRDELADELANLDAPISEISTGLDATGVRTAIGLASPDLDTQLAGISTKTSALPAAPAAVSDIPSAAANATAVRDELADELANLDAPISEISTGLDAAGVRTAVGLASPDLDTQLAGISTKTNALPAAPAAVSDIPSAAANATAAREELDPELERMRNVATVASVGQLLAETFNEDSAP